MTEDIVGKPYEPGATDIQPAINITPDYELPLTAIGSELTPVSNTNAGYIVIPVEPFEKYHIQTHFGKKDSRYYVYVTDANNIVIFRSYRQQDEGLPDSADYTFNYTVPTGSAKLWIMAAGGPTNQNKLKIQKLSSTTMRETFESAIAPHTASDLVAPNNITAGEFVFAAGKLYKATANITNGNKIRPGTNATATTIGEQLTAIFAALNA